MNLKSVFLSVIIFILICFIIPVLFTRRFKVVQANIIEENNIVENTYQVNNYDYKQYNKINLLHVSTGEVEEIELDEYLYGVVASEMPAIYEKEALKAQAVVARTYTIYKIINGAKHENANICDNSKCCQAWISKDDRYAKWNENERDSNWSKIVEAVNSTKGKAITYEGNVINAFFHANSGGTTETVINVWGGDNLPYLQSVQTSGEEAYTQYNSEVQFTKDELVEKIKEYHNDICIDFSTEKPIEILEYTDSGRVKIVRFGNLNLSGVEVRTILGLKSAKFNISIENDITKVSVIGYGHGVGMSQTGADSMAKQGSSYEDIIKHYYTGIEIIDI